MPENETIMEAPPKALSQLELILSRVEKFIDNIDKGDLKVFMKILSSVAKLAFRFARTSSKDKENFGEIVDAWDDIAKDL